MTIDRAKLPSKIFAWIDAPSPPAIASLGCGLYSKFDVLLLGKKYQIENVQQLNLFFSRLELAGSSYLADKKTEASHRTINSAKKDIKALTKANNKLLSTLQRTLESPDPRDKTRLYLERGHSWAQREAVDPQSLVSDTGAIILHDDGSKTLPELHMVMSNLKYLEIVCEKALAATPELKAGNRPARALAGWIQFVGEFWEQDLGRKVTVDSANGLPITDFGMFMFDCMRPLDPERLQGESKPSLMSQLIKFRTERNRKK